MNEPTLQNLASPTPSPVSASPQSGRWVWIALGLVVLVGAGLGGWWLTHRTVVIPVQQLVDPAKQASLSGLDQPQKLAGTCITTYTLDGLGLDSTGLQHYALSLQLVANPADAAALAQLLSAEPCTNELATIQSALKAKLGLEGKDGIAAQLSTSFKTKSGQRLFLP